MPQTGQPVRDEWDAFNQRAAGSALLHTAHEQRPVGVATAITDAATHCAFCSEALSPTSKYCSRCLRQVGSKASSEVQEAPAVTVAQPAPQPAPQPAAAPVAKAPALGGALYTLEAPARCPECEKEIRTFRVLRVLRTQVSFTSTLPRKGYAIVCPECERVLSAELSGLV